VARAVTTFFGRTVLATFREIVFFGVFDFTGATFFGRATTFFADLALLTLLAATLRAFFAGALAVVDRFAIGFGRAAFVLNARLLAEDFAADWREVDRRIPFAIGLLMMNSQERKLKR
jgi:hypothetical protein